jgi:hypothetical protein
MTVGIPVRTNPAPSKASKLVFLLARLTTEVVAAIGGVILKEHGVRGNPQSSTGTLACVFVSRTAH